LPENQSWRSEVLENIKVTPWKEQAVVEEPDVIHQEKFAEREKTEDEVPKMYESIPRDFYVTQEHVQRSGYTQRCPRCRVLLRGGKATQSHSKQCRERIRKCIQESPDDAEGLRKVEERRDEHFARIVEEQDEKAPEPASSSSHGRDEIEAESSKRRRFVSDAAIDEEAVENLFAEEEEDEFPDRGVKRNDNEVESRSSKRRVQDLGNDEDELLTCANGFSGTLGHSKQGSRVGFIEPSLCLSRLYETEENVLEFEEKLKSCM